MASKFEHWSKAAWETLAEVHKDTATHTAMRTGTETSVSLLAAEVIHGIDGNEIAQFSSNPTDLTIERGDYITYDGRTWRVLEVFEQEDGLYQISAIRAQEVN